MCGFDDVTEKFSLSIGTYILRLKMDMSSVSLEEPTDCHLFNFIKLLDRPLFHDIV